jgi:diguanylate cyclase
VPLYDNLTGLANRQLLADRLSQALVQAHRSDSFVSVLFIDLDQFKPVNDTLGHGIGDELLQAVANRLESCVRRSDTVGRYGGDEFIISLVYMTEAANAAACAEKILSRINVPFEVQGHQLRISASIGIASSSNKSTDSAVIPQTVDITSYVSGEVWRGQQLLDLLSLAPYRLMRS